jgi:hypothetical protein
MFHTSCKDTPLIIDNLTSVIEFEVDILKYDVN